MSHLSSVSSLVIGLNSLNSSPTLQQLGRGAPAPLSTDDETQNTSGLGLEHRLLFVEHSDKQLALNNANLGITFTQTADTALDQTVASVSELRALAVRANSSSLTDDERDELQEKADELIAEINTIASATTFNSKVVFDGSIDSISFQVGASTSEVVTLVSLRADAKGLGLEPGEYQTVSDRAELNQSVKGAQGIQEGDSDIGDITELKIQLGDNEVSQKINIADVAYGGRLNNVANTEQLTNSLHANYGSGIAKSAVERINEIRQAGQVEFKNLFASAETTFKGSDVVSDDYSGKVSTGKSKTITQGSLNRGDLMINGVKIDEAYFLSHDTSSSLTNAINAQKDKTGVEASVDTNGELQLTAYDGRDIVLSTSSAEVTNRLFGGGESRFSKQFTDLRISGRVSFFSEEELRFFGAGAFNLGLNDFTVDGTQENQAVNNNVSKISLASSSAAEQAVESIDAALAQIRNFRVSLHDARDQFTASIDHIAVSLSSQSASTVVSNLSNSLFKQQSAATLAAQANVDGRSALFLLR